MPRTVSPGSSCTLDVTFNPATVGSLESSVTINDTAGGSPHSYGLTGTGVHNGSSLDLQSSQAESTFGGAVTFSATIAPTLTSNSAAPTGSVVFSQGANTLGIAAVSNLHASLTTSVLHAGSYSISAAYGGDSNYGASNATATQIVDKAVPALTLATSANPVKPNTALQLTATVSSTAGTPSGAVTFMDGQSSLGTAPYTDLA